MVGMGRKDQREKNGGEKVKAVLELLRKQDPLTVKQEKFCNYACVGRFLKAKGDNVKKAAKHLRACLSWRESIGTEYLIADEFAAELAEGFAYVAGHDNDSRPVVIFRIKQDYQKFNSQKLFIRLLVFTLEVAIGSMPKNVEQFVLLFDASFYRSASAYMNFLLASLKIVSEYYPERLHKAFVIDPPSFFSYLWKGVRPFIDLSTVMMIVSSLDYEESSEYDDFSAFPRASSLRFDPSSIPSTGKIGTSSSTRFSFTVSHHSDSLKPWYLSLKDTSASSKVGTTISSPSASLMGPALISPLNARSFSFASPAARTPRCSTPGPTRKNNQFFTSTPLPQRVNNNSNPRTPRPSFLQSPAMFFRKEKDCHVSRTEKSRESFLPFLRFYRRPYDEMVYRSKMKPPLGGLISIVSPQIKRPHMSQSQRF
ncbi:phosphatidylinositol/phosphatidylcholine transfer protein SFH7-like [Telopea speciosissima]|uniref:phosphatidylinositol/phosphatidylcholine transfer protein SFH7-like n=1 Tax=Telopea speciosissima TaxID=54955 RepID=UPI001CC6E2D4|nr:phosphatidylinositol/phosphatidylcholine transfer protein SFH7-like [Telopea speciosissima]